MSDNSETRLKHAEKNEQAFQQYNERRARIEEQGGTPENEPVPFACECDNPLHAKGLSPLIAGGSRVW